jgi:hypothetical protein
MAVSTRFGAMAAMCATAASIFTKPGPQSIAGPRSRYGWNNRPCSGLQTLAARFARLGSGRSIVPCYNIGQIHKSDKQMIATECAKPRQAVEVSSK